MLSNCSVVPSAYHLTILNVLTSFSLGVETHRGTPRRTMSLMDGCRYSYNLTVTSPGTPKERSPSSSAECQTSKIRTCSSGYQLASQNRKNQSDLIIDDGASGLPL